MTNNRERGKRGERECRDAVARAWRCRATRTAQHSGKGKADVDALPGVHIECKRRRALSVLAFHDQAKADSEGTGDVPVVVMRADRDERWMLMLDLADFETLARIVLGHVDGEAKR